MPSSVDWATYERVMSSIEDLLNTALRALLGLFNDTPSHVSVEIPEDLPQPSALDRGELFPTKPS